MNALLLEKWSSMSVNDKERCMVLIGDKLEGVIQDGRLHFRRFDVVGNLRCTADVGADSEVVLFGGPDSYCCVDGRKDHRYLTVNEFEGYVLSAKVCMGCLNDDLVVGVIGEAL